MTLPDRPAPGSNLIAIHRAASRGIDVVIERSAFFARAGFGDPALRGGFIDYVGALVEAVDVHHQGEDDVAFPFLRERLPDGPYETLHAEHLQMLPLLAEMRTAAEEAASDEVSHQGGLERLAAAATELKRIWEPHIATEENTFDPAVLAEALTVAEQAQFGGSLGSHAQAHLSRPFLVLPFVMYNLPPAQRKDFASTLPPVITEQMVPQTWRELWTPMQPFLLE
jgi:hemerythrin-like domain-containing protein